ncbi:hypothetical protein TCEA9_15280 [Thermobrachium celere]|nr:hypothetical protein [Thermobrachium celere]GFR35716.1 hypothetical protein TCEA9_15280 [Thermobrachium celere]
MYILKVRGLFIIDHDGVDRYSIVHDLNIGRSVEETLRVLLAFQTGGLCSIYWKIGEEIL